MSRIDRDVLTRSLTGLVFLCVMISCILFSWTSTLILFSVIVCVASFEFARLTSAAHPWVYLFASLPLFIALTQAYSPWVTKLLIGTTILLNLIPHGKGAFVQSLTLRMLGLLLIPVAFALLAHPILAGPERMGILIFFIILWVYDTLAYVCGRLFGKRKLWARISPGKTWEGFIGGALFASVVSFLLRDYMDLSPVTAVLLGILISTFGTMGDLLESSFKRKAGVKDSGSFMPGHGGMLDRFDGVMIAAPAVFCFLLLISKA